MRWSFWRRNASRIALEASTPDTPSRLRTVRLLHAARLAIRFDVRPTRPALKPRDLVALGRNRSLQCRHLFQKLQNQVLQLGRRQTVNILKRRHAHKESDSRRLENLIIIPMPRLFPLYLRLPARAVPAARIRADPAMRFQ